MSVSVEEVLEVVNTYYNPDGTPKKGVIRVCIIDYDTGFKPRFAMAEKEKESCARFREDMRKFVAEHPECVPVLPNFKEATRG